MEELIISRISWWRFFLLALALLGVYFLLRFFVQLLGRVSLPWLELGPTRKVVRYIQMLYEPLAILLAATLFFLVHPVSNGLLLLLIGLATFSHIRNYFSGKLIALQSNLHVGIRIRVGDKQGRISHLGRLGIRLQSNDGQHYLNYGQLLAAGYTLVSGQEVGGLYQLRVTPQQAMQKTQLMDLLVTVPYLDWNYTPEILPSAAHPGSYETRVLLREEDHLQELTRLVLEWGFQCEVIATT